MKAPGGNAAAAKVSLCRMWRAEKEKKAKALLQQPDKEMPPRHAIKRGTDTQCSSRTPAPWAFSNSFASWDKAMSHCGVPSPAPTPLHTPLARPSSPGASKQRDS